MSEITSVIVKDTEYKYCDKSLDPLIQELKEEIQRLAEMISEEDL